MSSIKIKSFLLSIFCLIQMLGTAQRHPEIYITDAEKAFFLDRLKDSERVHHFVEDLKSHIQPYVLRHQTDPEWIVSRLQMYWKTKYKKVFVNGMDFSHGEGKAPVPTVRFSGSRDWATDYLQPALEDIKPYMDDERGLYLQNGKKDGQPWEWVKPSETGHIIERINREILNLAEDAAFLYWITNDKHYAVFASDILMKYVEGMYHRDPPETVGDHKNALLMGLQTFEVIHEGVIEPLTVCYDFLYAYLKGRGANLTMIQDVFRKWAEQEIKYGVPNNNWNLMQARYITYLAIALEEDNFYADKKGQEYYIDQVLNQNSAKQKALKDVVKNYDPVTAIWPEVAHYSMMVTDDMLEIYSLMDKAINNNLLDKYPTIEKAMLANFNYLFPNGFSTAYGDAKHRRLRFNSLELLIANYRKYDKSEKEKLLTEQLKRFIQEGAYSREKLSSLFNLFFYVDQLKEVPPATSFSSLVNPIFYSSNVSWLVQRNGHSRENGMMISKNASLGNHSHTNGINIELYAKGMVIAPDAAAGVSYWTEDHRNYYSRFPAHNTVIVDGISDYRNMRGTQAFTINSTYPAIGTPNPLTSNITLSDVSFIEPSTDANQQRLTASIRTSDSSGYFVDIFRSARNDKQDKKHEYLFHSQGEAIVLQNTEGTSIPTKETDELSSVKGDQLGYDYFKNKRSVKTGSDFIAQFKMPGISGKALNVNLWMKGFQGREIFTVEAPYSRAISKESVPGELYQQPIPTLVVRQNGEAETRPFVAIIDAFNENDEVFVKKVDYFSAKNENSGFVGIAVHSTNNRSDLLVNDRSPDEINLFEGGALKGRIGLYSVDSDGFSYMLLHHGSFFEYANLRLEIPEQSGDVLLKKISEGYEIDASHPFTLSIPVNEFNGEGLQLIIDGSKKVIESKIEQRGKIRFATFELPALQRTTLISK